MTRMMLWQRTSHFGSEYKYASGQVVVGELDGDSRAWVYLHKGEYRISRYCDTIGSTLTVLEEYHEPILTDR